MTRATLTQVARPRQRRVRGLPVCLLAAALLATVLHGDRSRHTAPQDAVAESPQPPAPDAGVAERDSRTRTAVPPSD